MFGWLKRLFGIASAEANAAINKLENPVKMTEQGIKDLKSDLNKSLQGLAEVKAMHIRAKKELEAAQRSESEYENKAILLLQKAEKGEISEVEADRLASQALAKKEQLGQRVAAQVKNVKHYEPMVAKMESNVQKLKEQISSWETELKTLKARSKVSEATSRLNKQMAQIDSSDTLARLERMKEKVSEQEALAESYADIADANTSIDDEIDKVLGSQNPSLEGSEALKSLKAKLAAEKNIEGGSSKSDTSGANTSADNATTGGGNSDLENLKRKLREDKESDGEG